MRRILLLYLAYVGLQFYTSTDPSVQKSWAVYAVLGLLALTGRWTCRVALETGLWLRILGVPFLFFYWGLANDVVAPGLACVLFAYSLWVLEGRRRWTFAVPLALPVLAIAIIKWRVMPDFFPKSVIASRIDDEIAIVPRDLPEGWVRYHCVGFSIGVPIGMTSGYLGGERADVFSYHRGLPKGEALTSMALVFPRRTAFSAEPGIREMAAQVFGVATEYDHARNVLNAHDGQMLLVEKLGWLGWVPPERIEEFHVRGTSGYLLSSQACNWYRARFYVDRDGFEHQAEVWIYGLDSSTTRGALPLSRDRVLQFLATLRVEPEERRLPTLAQCWDLTTAGSHLRANVLLNSLLSLDGGNYEALYLLGLNQERLGAPRKVFEVARRLEYVCAKGWLDRGLMTAWQTRYGCYGAPLVAR
ncbi:MAG: hypothetical protein HY303_11595 [Candidatus Wallbacteria bacterium]|nr:hypothetical protein [Candidatus Wallbacteria bacterium]